MRRRLAVTPGSRITDLVRGPVMVSRAVMT